MELKYQAEQDSVKSIAGTMFVMAVPSIIEQLLQTIVQYVDTAMVGRLGEAATAAVSVTTTITWLLNSIPAAFGVGVLALVSRALGEKNTAEAKRCAVVGLYAAVLLGILEGVLACLLSGYIPDWMGAEENIRRNASMYFLIVSVPIVFRTIDIILGSAIRATGDTKSPMLINFMVNVINIILNYELIYRQGLGVIGAAAATAVSTTLGGISMYLVFQKQFGITRILPREKPERAVLERCLKISLPAMLTNMISCGGYIMFAGIVSGMGTVIFAAHSIAVTAETIFYIPGYGMKTAVSAMSGFAIGEKNGKKFWIIVKISAVAALIMMSISGVILYLTAFVFMRIFTPNIEVARIGAGVLRLVAFSEPFFGLMIIMQGIYNGIGKTGKMFLIEMAGMWGVRILFALICVKVLHLGLTHVWYCMIADNVTKALLYVFGLAAMRKKIFCEEA